MSSDDDRRFDKRTIERRIEQGEVSQDEYEERLEDLPDLADDAEPMEAEFEVGVLDEDSSVAEEDEEADQEAEEDDEEEEDDE